MSLQINAPGTCEGLSKKIAAEWPKPAEGADKVPIHTTREQIEATRAAVLAALESVGKRAKGCRLVVEAMDIPKGQWSLNITLIPMEDLHV